MRKQDRRWSGTFRLIGSLALGIILVGLVGCPAPPPNGNSPSTALDSDGDGFPDTQERNSIPGSDPFDPNDTPLDPIDSDGDGCSDYDELNFDGFCDNDPNSSEPPGVDPDAAYTFALRVARHVDQPFSNRDVDAVFQEAGTVLQTVQTECPDVATNVTFQRDGLVETYDVAPAVITTEGQLDAVFDLPYDFKITHAMVGVCGVFDPDDMAVILGCAATGNSVVIVADADPDVWAHEWGHVQGLPHRDTCPRNVMHSFEIATNAVNAFERNAFLSPTPSFAAIREVSPPEFLDKRLMGRGSGETVPQWLDRVIRKRYVGGLPAHVVEGAGAEAAARLRFMLSDPDFVGPRRNVVRALGFCGDSGACGDLVRVIEGARGRLGFDEFGAVAEAFLALGRLVPRDGSNEALAYLIAGTDPEVWRSATPPWRYKSLEGEDLAGVLARLSVLGLGASKDSRALDHLRMLAEMQNVPGGDRVIKPQVDHVLNLLERPKAAASSPFVLRQP